MWQNEKLYETCKRWVQAALLFLDTKLPVPLVEEKKITQITATGYKMEGGHYRPAWERFCLAHRSDLLCLQEFAALMEIISSDATLAAILFSNSGGAVATETEEQKNNLAEYLHILLLEYVRSNNNLTFEQTLFDSIYEKLEQYIYSLELFDAVWLAYFRNLTLEIDEIVLEEGIRLRKASKEEQEAAILDTFRQHFDDIPQVFLEIHQPIERFGIANATYQEKANNAIHSALLALRLIKEHPVGHSYSEWHIVDQPFRLTGSFKMTTGLQFSTYRGTPYLLTQSDAVELQNLWPKVKRMVRVIDQENQRNEVSALSIALTRWDDSYGRRQERDQLIDYWTALDALFGSQDVQLRDMGETVALVLAHYLGKNARERTSIREDIRRSFKVRSHVIHGKKGKPPEDLHLMTIKTREHLRHALWKLIQEDPS